MRYYITACLLATVVFVSTNSSDAEVVPIVNDVPREEIFMAAQQTTRHVLAVVVAQDGDCALARNDIDVFFCCQTIP